MCVKVPEIKEIAAVVSESGFPLHKYLSIMCVVIKCLHHAGDAEGSEEAILAVVKRVSSITKDSAHRSSHALAKVRAFQCSFQSIYPLGHPMLFYIKEDQSILPKAI